MTDETDDSQINHHFIVEMQKDGKTHYVVCEPVYSFAKEALSDATHGGIASLIDNNALRAAALTGPAKSLLPVSMQSASRQSGGQSNN
ncbi:hypothetical protein WBP07_29610 [Novosphingobium sp. BL-8A]|uniref:hypothetical protein n=1 Tax=Novosphingobium sp. BL-8A TaxID=3127639 RepID=UPI00375718A5